MPEQETPTIPARLRTALYITGAFLGIGIAPALYAIGLEPLSVVAGSLSGACNAVAFGYRPTK